MARSPFNTLGAASVLAQSAFNTLGAASVLAQSAFNTPGAASVLAVDYKGLFPFKLFYQGFKLFLGIQPRCFRLFQLGFYLGLALQTGGEISFTGDIVQR
ncbi:hypothetical protein EZJ58_3092 [Sodalis ligni]|uniref:Uncharacterized protein n=1 Tax=Sodalis ligni TaxID=2697027 RepID=A0A4R1NDP1_9GAMM|nr:hypothetical protein EZJ58_3092 [Sodalis ligni]